MPFQTFSAAEMIIQVCTCEPCIDIHISRHYHSQKFIAVDWIVRLYLAPGRMEPGVTFTVEPAISEGSPQVRSHIQFFALKLRNIHRMLFRSKCSRMAGQQSAEMIAGRP